MLLPWHTFQGVPVPLPRASRSPLGGLRFLCPRHPVIFPQLPRAGTRAERGSRTPGGWWMKGGRGSPADLPAQPCSGPPSRVYGDDISFPNLPVLECFADPSSDRFPPPRRGGEPVQSFISSPLCFVYHCEQMAPHTPICTGLGIPRLKRSPLPSGQNVSKSSPRSQNNTVRICGEWTNKCYEWVCRGDGQSLMPILLIAIPQDR